MNSQLTDLLWYHFYILGLPFADLELDDSNQAIKMQLKFEIPRIEIHSF